MPDPENPAKDTGTGVTGPAQNRLNDVYKASAINTPAALWTSV